MVGNYYIQKELRMIFEAYRHIYEDAEGRNINKAEKYIKSKHPEMIGRKLRDGRIVTPRLITQELRNMIPNSRLAKCRFLEGVARIYLDEIMKTRNGQRMTGLLNQYLGVLAQKEYVEKYDTNLNGMSFDDVKRICESVLKANLEKDRKELSFRHFNRRNDIRIVKILSFKDAEKYGEYTDWCICHDEDMYDNYTNGNTGMFYFILSDDFIQEKRIKGENSPYDEYGLSMVAICVNSDGTLNTCTTRWNHDNGGTDYSMTTGEISELVGGNFYEIFRPRGLVEKWMAHSQNRVEDDGIAKRLGGIKTQVNGRNTRYVVRKDDGLDEYKVIKRLSDGRTCIAKDRFYWYDKDGNEIEPPDELKGDFLVHNVDTLKSLEGMPRRVTGTVLLTELDGIRNLDGLSEWIGDTLNIRKCVNLKNIEDAKGRYNYILVSGCPSISIEPVSYRLAA